MKAHCKYKKRRIKDQFDHFGRRRASVKKTRSRREVRRHRHIATAEHLYPSGCQARPCHLRPPRAVCFAVVLVSQVLALVDALPPPSRQSSARASLSADGCRPTANARRRPMLLAGRSALARRSLSRPLSCAWSRRQHGGGWRAAPPELAARLAAGVGQSVAVRSELAASLSSSWRA